VGDGGDEDVPPLAQLDHAAQQGGHGEGGQEREGPGSGQRQAHRGRAGPRRQRHRSRQEAHGQRGQASLFVRTRTRRHRLQSCARKQILDRRQEAGAQARPVEPASLHVDRVAHVHAAREHQRVADPQRRRRALARRQPPTRVGGRWLQRGGRDGGHLGGDGIGEALLARLVFLDVLHLLQRRLIVRGHDDVGGWRRRLAGEPRGDVGAAESRAQRVEASRGFLGRGDVSSGSDLEVEQDFGRRLARRRRGGARIARQRRGRPGRLLRQQRQEGGVQPPEREPRVLLERGLGACLLLRALQSENGEADPHHRAQKGGGTGGEDEPDPARPHEPAPSRR
jgi:hypothetical protein